MPIPKGLKPTRVNGSPPQEHVKVIKTPPQDLDINKLVERAKEVERIRTTEDAND